MIDTTILIDYFRKSNKANSRLVAHFQQYDELYISTITGFEIFNGATEAHKQFWGRYISKKVKNSIFIFARKVIFINAKT